MAVQAALVMRSRARRRTRMLVFLRTTPYSLQRNVTIQTYLAVSAPAESLKWRARARQLRYQAAPPERSRLDVKALVLPPAAGEQNLTGRRKCQLELSRKGSLGSWQRSATRLCLPRTRIITGRPQPAPRRSRPSRRAYSQWRSRQSELRAMRSVPCLRRRCTWRIRPALRWQRLRARPSHRRFHRRGMEFLMGRLSSQQGGLSSPKSSQFVPSLRVRNRAASLPDQVPNHAHLTGQAARSHALMQSPALMCSRA
mmetsp:Transcript_6371/g.18176  ORF Transcript_6371/g.18176 Transcript_6371/m.18176 type:complete len:255 (+) Transcript_6371:645-1409(+)